MADILQYFKLVPAYTTDVVGLLSSPKRFLDGRGRSEPDNWLRATTFFVLTIGIVIVLNNFAAPSKSDFAERLLRDVVGYGAGAVLTAIAVAVSWKIVRAEVSLARSFLTQLYVFPILLVIANVWIALQLNVLALFRPSQHQDVMDRFNKGTVDFNNLAATSVNLEANDLMRQIVMVGFLIMFFISIVWLISTWGVYRRTNSATRLRSAMAFIICFTLSVPILVLLSFMTRAGLALR